ncbi:MAG: hypothetical protein DELT_00436 [Desulfovibrio sp.]
MPASAKTPFRRRRSVLVAACLLFFLPVAASLFWPVPDFVVAVAAPPNLSGAGYETGSTVLLREKCLLGRDITASIVHSVQRTPVIDVYRAQEGRIWAWREKIQSHNAGLPSLKPERGRFIYDDPWMIVEGGGASWETIRYRVGDEIFGKNELCVFASPCRELWREVPGKVLVLRIE